MANSSRTGATAGKTQHQILIVEDDDQLRSILERVLVRCGHLVETTGSGAAARQVLADRQIDVLLLDINLPDETGWALLRWLHDQPWPRPRVIALTAGWAMRPGKCSPKPDAVLTKPFPIDALIRLVDNVAPSEPKRALAYGPGAE